MQKNKAGDPCIIPHTKITYKWIKGLHIRAKSIQLIETEVNVHNLGCGSVFLDWTTKAQAQREKNRYIRLHQNRMLSHT